MGRRVQRIDDHDTPRLRRSAFPRLATAAIAGGMFAVVLATARPSADAPGVTSRDSTAESWLSSAPIQHGLTPVLQQGGRGGRGGAPPAPGRAGAPVDLVGTWVSVVTEDWEWRMVTPVPGDVTSVPVTPLGRKAAASWTPAQEGRCEAYGVGGLMRMPGRLRISWQDDFTLKIESDQGQQTRLLNFAKPGAPIMSAPPGTARTLQGYSAAEWQRAGGAQDAFLERAVGAAGGTQRWGSLKVTTTNVAPGWLRRNGVPYGENAVITEYFIRFAHPEAGDWFVVTTIVEDPQYLTQPFITSSNFKKEPNDSKWSPVACRTN
jgi:hypothetical protein